MLQQFPTFTTPIKQLTQADSLKITMQHMQAKMDSLEKVVMKTEIGTGYFTGIIALQLGVFLFLVSLAGFLSWKWLQNQISETRDECIKHADVLIENHTKTYDDNLSSLQIELRKTIFDATRAMYFIASKEDHIGNIFTWSLSCASTLYQFMPEKLENVKWWLVTAKENVQKIQPGDQSIIDATEVISEEILRLQPCEHEEIMTLVAEITAELNHILYYMKDRGGVDDEIKEDAFVEAVIQPT